MKKFAFTLAEVLITLGIIGVVAALTIPTLIQNQQKTQYVSALQKTYAVLNQAFAKYAADNGCVGDINCTGLFSGTVNTTNNLAMWDDFATNYLKVAKNCSTSTDQDCFSSLYRCLNNPSTGNPYNTSAGAYKVVLQDGTSLAFSVTGIVARQNCEYAQTFGGSGGICAWIDIDTNGQKSPNVYGRDLFSSIVLTKSKGLMTWYGSRAYSAADICGGASCYWKNANGSDPNTTCSTSLNSVGTACVSRIIDEGWQMNY